MDNAASKTRDDQRIYEIPAERLEDKNCTDDIPAQDWWKEEKKNKPEKRKGLVFVFSLFVTLNEGVKAGCWHRPSKFGYLLFGRRYLKMTSAYALFILLGVPVCSHKTRLQLGVMTVSRKSGTFSMLK